MLVWPSSVKYDGSGIVLRGLSCAFAHSSCEGHRESQQSFTAEVKQEPEATVLARLELGRLRQHDVDGE